VRKPRVVHRAALAAARSRLVTPYGLFSVMTTTRPEVIIEGSNDGVRWSEYGFRYKVGDPMRPPRRVAPLHQPRLDWQMWFAAMTQPPAWFMALLVRVLEGSPEVLGLLDGNPFPAAPPRFVRALLYEYKMTDLETHRRTGAWWTRKKLGVYVPTVSLGRGEEWVQGDWEQGPMVWA
jgi:hypothetical protein